LKIVLRSNMSELVQYWNKYNTDILKSTVPWL